SAPVEPGVRRGNDLREASAMATPSEPSGPPRRIRRPASEIDLEPDSFALAFGEDLSSVLDVSTWQTGRDLDAEYARIEHQVRLAVACETEYQAHVRAD